MIEIGPGLGSLDEAAGPACRPGTGRWRSISICCRFLRQELASYDQVEVIQADALKIDFAALLADWPGPLRLAANLPYYITTSVLEKVLSERPDLAS